MKGGIAAILGAVRALGVTRRPGRLHGELVVAFVPSEEDGGQGTLAAIRAGATGDLCVIPEPSNLDVVIAHAGAVTFRLTVPGRAAHASRRTRGRVRARQPGRRSSAPWRPTRGAATRRRRIPLMTALGHAVPDDHRDRGGRGVGVHGHRPGRGRRPLRRAPRPVPGRGGRGSWRPASPPPARRTRSCATTPRPSRSWARGSRSARVPADHPLPLGSLAAAMAVTGPAPGARSGSRTAPTCGCSSVSGRRRASSSGPATSAWPTAPTSACPLGEVEACARVLAAWVADELGATRG